jgi:Uma2 family endonuclease
MSLHDPQSATYADIEALPPNVVGEILFGSLVTHPRPAYAHGAASSALGVAIGGPFQFGSGGPGGWTFIDEPELHLGPHIVVPDIAGWRRERLGNAGKNAWLEIEPDWICEVLSPSTEAYDKGAKRRIYATYGVNHLWHLDPRTKVLEVFLRQDTSWLLTHDFTGEEDVCAPPFEAITFSLGLLWPFDPPSADSNDEA